MVLGCEWVTIIPGQGYGDKDINRAMIYIYLWLRIPDKGINRAMTYIYPWLRIPLYRGWMGRSMDDMA